MISGEVHSTVSVVAAADGAGAALDAALDTGGPVVGTDGRVAIWTKAASECVLSPPPP